MLVNGTARCLLEMLFGAGMVILTERAARTADKWVVMRRYYVRNLVLLAFGLAHMFLLLWGGDILHTYAIAALIVFWARNFRSRWLIGMGLLIGLLQLGGAGYFDVYPGIQRQAQVAAAQARADAREPLTTADRELLAKAAERYAKNIEEKAKHDARLAREDKGRSSSTTAWIDEHLQESRYQALNTDKIFAILKSASVMLLGAGLFKLGILQGRRSWRFYWILTFLCYAIGGSARVIGGMEQVRFDDGPMTIAATQEIARQMMTLGHVGLVNLLVMTVPGTRMLQPFVAAGQTALSIYVLQTLICLWVLYPPFAFGLYGEAGWAGMMATAAGINLALLVLANLWIKWFAIAPVEWAWRSLVEWRRLPWRTPKRRAAVPSA